MNRIFALSVLLATACSDSTSTTRPDLAAVNVECYEGNATADTMQIGTYPDICAFRDGMAPEVNDNTSMGRLILGCDSSKVRVEMRYHDDEEFASVACHDEVDAELICNWTTRFKITLTSPPFRRHLWIGGLFCF